MNKHGVKRCDVFVFRYYGINVFLKVHDTFEDKVTAYELNTYKYKGTNKIFDKWKSENPDKKIDDKWFEMLKTTRRAKKPVDCMMVSPYSTNTMTKPSLVFKTGYAKGEPTLIVPITQKTKLYWKAKYKADNPREGIMLAKPIIRYDDKYSDMRKKLFIFYPYDKPEKEDSGAAEA